MTRFGHWTLEGRIMEDHDPGDFELLWTVTSGPKPPHDDYEVEVVDAAAHQGAIDRIAALERALMDVALTPDSDSGIRLAKAERALAAARAQS